MIIQIPQIAEDASRQHKSDLKFKKKKKSQDSTKMLFMGAKDARGGKERFSRHRLCTHLTLKTTLICLLLYHIIPYAYRAPSSSVT